MKRAQSKEGIPGYILASAAIIALIIAPIASRVVFEHGPQKALYSRILMGTVVELTLMEGENFDAAAEAAFSEIQRLEGLLSSYIPDSDVSKISSEGPVKVAPEVMDVLDAALRVARLSKGAFDPTIGALAGLWGLSGEKGVVPDRKEVEKLLPLVDYREIYIDRKNSRAGLKKKGMSLNLGGVAKGYIVGRTAGVLKSMGVTKGIVKAGGDLYVFQREGLDQKPFVIGIQHPRAPEKLLAEVHVTSGAVTTSGDYERFFMKDGVRYHHIIDPSTGFPARKSMSVTIVSEDPTIADALSTAVFVMGPKEGMELVERLEGVEAVIVDSQGRVHVSPGLKGRIVLY